MRWGGFGLALLITLLLQKTLVWGLGLTAIDLFLVLALLCGLCAPTADARIAGWLIGFAQDLGADAAALGANALGLGACCLLLTWLRDRTHARDWWVRLVIAFVAALPAQLFFLWYLHSVLGYQARGFWSILASAALIAALAAALAVAALLGAQPWFVVRRRHGLRGAIH